MSAAPASHPSTGAPGLARNLLKIWPALWTFSEVDGVEATNNRAERGLRGAVIYRKLSLGSQSEAGERTIERLLSASQTCRLAGLPARETEVLQLVADGLRNAEIAERLYLSPRTVDHQVSAILRKLGAGTRGEAVASARRLDLLQDR